MNVCDFFNIFVNSLVCLILGPNKFFIPPILRKLVLIPYYHLKSATEMCITNGIHDENIISALSAYQININSITALKDYLNSLHSNNAEIIYITDYLMIL